ncbi:MAG: hypothetical protein EBX52_05480 [Proteobacteria bacterium]|nr:hypothetical protein [Pseudomonadota bacterium]
MLVKALLAIDLQNGGAEILPGAVVQLRNLLGVFETSIPYQQLATAYTGNVARGEVEEAKREASLLLSALTRAQRESALELYGIHPPEDPFWETLRSRPPAQFEKLVVQDLDGKNHTLLVLMGHPEGGSSAIERFHRAIRSRYGAELYINDDLVPSALGFYQGVPDGGNLKDSFIIIRGDYFTQDFLDYVGFHEGRHAMFKRIRMDSQAVEAVEIQLKADPGKRLPSWMPSPEGGVYLDSYSRFMTFEENYNHAKDLKYAVRVRHEAVLDAFAEKKELPARLLFDLGLVSDKLKLLREVTHRTKASALASKVIEKRDLLSDAFTRKDPELLQKRWMEFEPLLGAFQKNISKRLIESYDFGLSVRINLGKLEMLFQEVENSEGITLSRYLEFRKALFDTGREAYEWLFKSRR